MTTGIRSPRDMFLNQLTGIDREFDNWESWQILMEWLKRQPWKGELLGNTGGKIPSRLMHPSTLADEISRYLGGPEDNI